MPLPILTVVQNGPPIVRIAVDKTGTSIRKGSALAVEKKGGEMGKNKLVSFDSGTQKVRAIDSFIADLTTEENYKIEVDNQLGETIYVSMGPSKIGDLKIKLTRIPFPNVSDPIIVTEEKKGTLFSRLKQALTRGF